MSKIRPLPILISGIIAAVVLFGGWFAYRNFAVDSPLSSLIAALPAVEQGNAKISGSELQVDVNVKRDADLQAIADRIYKEAPGIAGADKVVRLSMNGQSTETLDRWWRETLFDIAQAMDTKQYAQIPAALEKHAASLTGLTYETAMDAHNVYIKLEYDNGYKAIVLPRTPDRLEVWPNA